MTKAQSKTKTQEKSGIIKGFDMNELRRKRARSSRTGLSLVEGLDEISPEIALLDVGDTAKIYVDGERKDGKAVNLRKTTMQIAAKLRFLTCQGGEWEGRDYIVASDGSDNVYVQRGEDLPEDQIKPRVAGGRGRKSDHTIAKEALLNGKSETPKGKLAKEAETSEKDDASNDVMIIEHN